MDRRAGSNRPRDEDAGRMPAYRAVLFDLLTALLDSRTLWDDVAGGAAAPRRWRGRYLELTYAAGPYRPYADIVAEAAADVGLVSAERAGFYKPRPEAYGAALAELGVPAERALFVAGSPADVPGAQAAGMPVVWHNRLGLPAVGSVPPLATIETLTPLTTLTARGSPDPRG